MGKLWIGLVVGALLMAIADDWRRGDLSLSHLLGKVQDSGRLLLSATN